MSSTNLNPTSDPDLQQTPILAFKQALCFCCWDVSSNLKRCIACRRVSYCSVKCQKQDWNRYHKKICKKLVIFSEKKEVVPATSRNWSAFYNEKILELLTLGPEPSNLGRLIGYEPYCYHCYRTESQLEHGTKLKACQNCNLTSFCTACPQDHPSEECATLQDVAADDKILVKLQRQTGKDSIICITPFPQPRCQPVSSATDWYDYYTRLSDKALFASKMTRDLKYLGKNSNEREYVEYMRHGTNTISTQLTLLAALEATIPNLSARHTISIHIVGAAAPESTALPAFEEILHLLPALQVLHVALIGPNTKPLTQHAPCCPGCTKRNRSIHTTMYRGPYHSFLDASSFEKPDLAAAFHSGFSVDEQFSWRPTIEYLARAPHPTVFTAARYFEIREEMEIWKGLGAGFVRGAEVNMWRGLAGSLGIAGERRNELNYRNYWWYIVKGKGL